MAKMKYWRDKTEEEKKQYWLNYNIKSRMKSSKYRAGPAYCKWADDNKLKEIYKRACLMEQETGEKYDVDHIIPLNSDFVCGLHVENNLRIITKKENCSKYNKII